MQDETGVIFIILLGILLAVALGISLKWRVKEALTNVGTTNSQMGAKGRAKTGPLKKESYRNVTDYLGDTVSVNGPRAGGSGPSYRSTEGMINLGTRGRVREPFASGDVNAKAQELRGKKVKRKGKNALMTDGPTSDVYVG